MRRCRVLSILLDDDDVGRSIRLTDTNAARSVRRSRRE
jgi:hypothetical protein